MSLVDGKNRHPHNREVTFIVFGSRSAPGIIESDRMNDIGNGLRKLQLAASVVNVIDCDFRPRMGETSDDLKVFHCSN